MKLIRLHLKNFKGIRNFEFQPNGQSASIYGDNAVGKTTIFDAFNWLLFDKDSQNKKDFDIKTLDVNNQPIHGLDHEVEAVFDIDGKPLTLRKVYYEQWTKKRGSATAEFTGHTTDYYINGVPVQKKEYTAKIDEIAPEEIFKLLTSPTYFNTQLHWRDRRRILLEVCGDIQDSEVIASNEKLKHLPEILQGRTIEEHQKIIAAKRAEINKELEKIPVRIDEAERSIPELPERSREDLMASLMSFQKALGDKNRQLSDIQNGGTIAQKRRELQEIETEIIRIKNENQSRGTERLKPLYEKLQDSKEKVFDLQRDINTEQRLLDQKKANLSALQSAINTLREQWYQIKNEQLVFEQAEVCPTCGQPIPAEQLEEAREKAIADFNRKKAERLEKIDQEGKKTKAEMEKLQIVIGEDEQRIQLMQEQLIVQEAETARIQTEIERVKAEPIETIGIEEQLKRKQAIETEIAQLQTDTSEAVAKIRAEIAGINDCISQYQNELAKIEQRERIMQRIEELKQQERELAKEFERLEAELFMTEEFIRTKVNLLEDKINSRFQYARFKLFTVQINGGIQECCETLYNGVPYSSGLNTGHQNIVGLDIINTLSEHYGFTAPIFIDNRESITRLPETKAQIISLVVSAADKKLRVEYPETILKEAV